MHIPVLVDEVIKFLSPENNKIFIDATIGCGGHTKKILEVSPGCKIIGIDWDEDAIKFCYSFLRDEIQKGKVYIVKESYVNIKNIIKNLDIGRVDGILFDFGMSKLQLSLDRGFSFSDSSFDMRMSSILSTSAFNVINKFSQKELENIFFTYGEERYSKLVSRKIVEYRQKKQICSSKELADLIYQWIGKFYRRQNIHPATRIFQALRIYINNELDNIEKGLNNAVDILSPGGRCVAITYHSLEDRIVKNVFKSQKSCKILTKKPVVPSNEEIKKNLSSRSAKLRAIEKI